MAEGDRRCQMFPKNRALPSGDRSGKISSRSPFDISWMSRHGPEWCKYEWAYVAPPPQGFLRDRCPMTWSVNGQVFHNLVKEGLPTIGRPTLIFLMLLANRWECILQARPLGRLECVAG